MKKTFFVIAVLGFLAVNIYAEEFYFKYNKGDRYRILSTVHEEIYADHKLNHVSEILNRIAVEVTEASGDKGYHKAVFQTSERILDSEEDIESGSFISGGFYQWAREYESEFERDKLGRYTIDNKYFMPQVRDVPVLPGRAIVPGEKWVRPGYEVHDFRDNFGITEPYKIPFTADYEYLGEQIWKDKTFPAFSVNYQILFNGRPAPGKTALRRIKGVSNQIVFWDLELGQPVAYKEDFHYTFELSNGRIFEYKGTAEAEIIESEFMDKEKLAEEITGEIGRLDIQDVTVRVADEGIVISLDDIQFYPDSTEMLPGELEKLNKIIDILLQHQERDIMVAGHTALAGTREGQQRLSVQRAAVIADYLITQKARPPQRIVVHGFGADKPIAENSTEAGRRKNRRVEIILLEN